MRNLEEEIAGWRKRMAAGGIKAPAVLDELESHLREEIRARMAAGTSGEQAIQEALSRMGSADSLRREFNKVHGSGAWLFTSGLFLWLGIAGALAIYLNRRLADGRMGFLLATHVFSLTTGYLAAFMAGIGSAMYVCTQWTGKNASVFRQRLSSGITWFIDLTTVLVIVGFVLGMLWSEQHYGRYWIKNVREIGATFALVGSVALSVAWRIRHLNEETRALMGLGSSLTIGLAWFGMLLIARGQPIGSSWPLCMFIGAHLVCMTFGFSRRLKPVVS